MAAEPDRDDPISRGRRWLLIGCGLALLVLVAVLVGGVAGVPKLLAQGLALNRQRVVRALAPDVAPSLRDRVGRSFDCVITAASREALDEGALASLGEVTRRVLADGTVSAAEAESLAAVLEGLCRGAGRR